MNNITLWVRRYVTVYGIIMLCTFFMCLLFNPTSELPVVTFFGRIMVFTLIALLSLAVYYSKDELTVKAWWVRTALHLPAGQSAVASGGLRSQRENRSADQ